MNSNAPRLVIGCCKEWNIAILVDEELRRFGIDYSIYAGGVGGQVADQIVSDKVVKEQVVIQLGSRANLGS